MYQVSLLFVAFILLLIFLLIYFFANSAVLGALFFTAMLVLEWDTIYLFDK